MRLPFFAPAVRLLLLLPCLSASTLRAAPPADPVKEAQAALRVAENKLAAAETQLKQHEKALKVIEQRLKEMPFAIRNEMERLREAEAALAQADEARVQGSAKLKGADAWVKELEAVEQQTRAGIASADAAAVAARESAEKAFRASEEYRRAKESMAQAQKRVEEATAVVRERLEATPDYAALKQAHATAQGELTALRQARPEDASALAAAEKRVAEAFAKAGVARDTALRADADCAAAQSHLAAQRVVIANLERTFAEKLLPQDEPYRTATAAAEEARKTADALEKKVAAASGDRKRIESDLKKVHAVAAATSLEVQTIGKRVADLEATNRALEVDQRAAERRLARSELDVRDARRAVDEARARLREAEKGK